MILSSKSTVGGGFLVEDVLPETMFTPEDFTDEHVMMADMTEKFIMNDVMAVLGRIEEQQFDQTLLMMRKAGDLGLLGIDVPEEYGGLQLDKISASVITEKIAVSRSFAITYSGQIGIGSLPIVYFGTDEQKKKYLPGIISGEKIGAYALTEPTSGTDALSAKTTAKLSDCGSYYVLNGEKQWITNSAFADIFIVYAKVDGEKFTAFIVEKDYNGLSTGPEEKKMGLKGSSTRSLILEDVKVPVENVLGELGKGHVIAFNILNIGRHKISTQCVGTSKRAIELSVKYAKERKQFGQSISEFNLIKGKIADMAIRTYVNESMVYRTAGLIENAFNESDKSTVNPAKVISEFAVECSINKVFSTEVYDSIIDEALQIHGGYGYMSEYEVETLYRDSRVNRIFEGTNEINRIIIASTLLRKLNLNETEIESKIKSDDLLAQEKEALYTLKAIYKDLSITVQDKFLEKNKEQELMALIADLVIAIYAAESAIIRSIKAVQRNGSEQEEQKLNYTKVYVKETSSKMLLQIINFLPYIGDNQLSASVLRQAEKLMLSSSVDTVSLKRKIADHILAAEEYTS
ncbi:acyl-CoA dehydrogenase family protein [Bacillus sp. Marseille-P3661]|uniref:acyl-CoA dehydrogenase family protein n=1 Tax=Bacillus sp. Marseille-P3661 TaxID=1936234 RepID=UPI000C855019|nr:acyl-CoA dehydrogenase family protein [Bacillus sp. Marseille-P3661]